MSYISFGQNALARMGTRPTYSSRAVHRSRVVTSRGVAAQIVRPSRCTLVVVAGPQPDTDTDGTLDFPQVSRSTYARFNDSSCKRRWVPRMSVCFGIAPLEPSAGVPFMISSSDVSISECTSFCTKSRIWCSDTLLPLNGMFSKQGN